MTRNLAAGVIIRRPVRSTEGDNMAMDKLIKEVNECIEREYGRAGAKFGLTNHSDHESYAVLLEEFEEAKCEFEFVEKYLREFWDCVKSDFSLYDKAVYCQDTQRRALLCACEMIQVAAMAKKAALTIIDRATRVELLEEEGGS